MTNATNLIHRFAELRAGVLYRIRLNWRGPELSRTFHAEHMKLRASLAAIDSCADAAEVLREVRKSSRRLYWLHLKPAETEVFAQHASRALAAA
jgi:hypothetical protein